MIRQTVVLLFVFSAMAICLVIASPVIKRKDSNSNKNKLVSITIEELKTIFEEKVKPAPPCIACEIILPIAHKALIENNTEQLEFITKSVCNLFKIESPTVCTQVVDEYLYSVTSVALVTTISDKDLCAAFLNCGTPESPLLNWNISLPNVPKPPVVPPKPPKAGAPTLRILHLSDIHIDFEYQPGALAVCMDPICCRNESTPKPGQPITPNLLAGYWGDIRHCDVPFYTVQNLFEHISQNEKFDFVYWTGDLPPHNVWHQDRNQAISALRVLTDLFLQYFPGKIIYPSLGNHEAAPCNLYPTPVTTADNLDWLYTELAQDWIKTGLPSSLVSSIKYGAFYYLDIQPGLRLISMNMNYCPTLNFWLFINSTDPLNQLKWLANTLQDCEDKGLKAHIIGHINPAGCMSSWSYNFYRIVNRYESTISGQFYGHTHFDEMEIFYDQDEPTRPTNIAYITESVTTEPTLFPGYRVYTVDGGYTDASYYVTDHDNYILNITDANLTNKPKWTKEYSAKETYGFENMFPADWNNLISRLIKNPSDPLAKKFYDYYHKSTGNQPHCDGNCLSEFLCKFKQARPGQIIQC